MVLSSRFWRGGVRRCHCATCEPELMRRPNLAELYF
jgi:hypothetical protein